MGSHKHIYIITLLHAYGYSISHVHVKCSYPCSTHSRGKVFLSAFFF
eukprot:NODE_7666_length_234_cov_6.481081_g7583_i0.p1 GENE.NODE_7666_length_234_cov_6.481081_g7583_i0~~NODE_7666_length_234_cov_6.481081_g7583_i0.p1  ORF type:complete len:57 (-),score=15.81 NODE_7666_length_234_cov_6.481081_g7583_i0:64-204(-)